MSFYPVLFPLSPPTYPAFPPHFPPISPQFPRLIPLSPPFPPNLSRLIPLVCRFSHIESQNRGNPFFADAKEKAKVLVVAKSDDVLGKVLQLVRERGVHRIYVCGKHNKPVGVVTLTDILARMAQAADPLTHEIMERFA